MIPQIPATWAYFPPVSPDTQYWRECHRLEAQKARLRAPRPNPELQRNIGQYWQNLLSESNDNPTQQS